jgi:hypothetical protein
MTSILVLCRQCHPHGAPSCARDAPRRPLRPVPTNRATRGAHPTAGDDMCCHPFLAVTGRPEGWPSKFHLEA